MTWHTKYVPRDNSVMTAKDGKNMSVQHKEACKIVQNGQRGAGQQIKGSFGGWVSTHDTG